MGKMIYDCLLCKTCHLSLKELIYGKRLMSTIMFNPEGRRLLLIKLMIKFILILD